jgi:hypothetical protein
MFPNVRLMIVAIMASIVGIGCGLGMFAVFRVNHDPLHDPFVRLANGATPMQLVFSNALPSAMTDAAATPFGIRFEIKAPRTGGGETPQPVSAMPGEAGPAAAAPPSVGATTATPPPDAPDSATVQSAGPHGPAQAAIQPPAEQAAPAGRLVPDRKPAPATAASGAPTRAGKSAHTALKHPRIAKQRRLRKPRAAAVAGSRDQNSGLAQPTYEFTTATPVKTKPARVRRAAGNPAATPSQ